MSTTSHDITHPLCDWALVNTHCGSHVLTYGPIFDSSESLGESFRRRPHEPLADTMSSPIAPISKRITFTKLVKAVLKELEGSFAFVSKSKHNPDKVITACRGSPLLVGVKTNKMLKVDFVDIEFAGQETDLKITDSCELVNSLERLHPFSDTVFTVSPSVPSIGLLAAPIINPNIMRTQSRVFMSEDGLPLAIEFFVASDTAAIVEHTKRVLYLEDDDIAHIP